MTDERETIGQTKAGALLTRLTDSARTGGYACHLYLNVPTFSTDGRHLVFISTRGCANAAPGRRQNLFVMDLGNGRIQRVTDLADANMHAGWFDPKTLRHYFWHGPHLAAADLTAGRCQNVFYEPARQRSMIGLTCDGRFAVYATCEDPPEHRGPDVFTLWRVDLAAGSRERILTAGFRISHVQCSPIDPDFVLYNWECMSPHRQPYVPVMQRMWWTNLAGTQGGPFGQQRPNEGRTHEFFTVDGRFVGYHGAHHCPAGPPTDESITTFTFGLVEAATRRDAMQVSLAGPPGHCQASDDGRLVCCDAAGGGDIGLIRCQGPASFVPLYPHGSSMTGQHTHPHPQFRPGKVEIVFSTDRARLGGSSGRSDVYLLGLPENSSRGTCPLPEGNTRGA
jgi:hypothetical protein